MSIKWFEGKIDHPEETSFLFKDTTKLWHSFELFEDGVYQGWVFIYPDGRIEFGEPAA